MSQPSCGLGLGDALLLPKKYLAGVLLLLRAPEACAVRRMCGGAAHDHHGYVARVGWSCLLLRIILQDALGEVTKFYSSLKMRVFVDDITALVKGRNGDVVEMAQKR